MMDLSGKVYSPAHNFLQNTSSLVSAYGLGSSLVTGQSSHTTSLYTGTSHTLTSPVFSGSFSSSLSPSHTSYSNGHGIVPHRQADKHSDTTAKSHLYASPAPVFTRHKDSFPYGISGVPMPNYGYHGDVYQFTSNGYPRKSRTCSYCGKVFTRSTTRRYHEKRCPLLRAAVSSYMGEENSGTGASTPQSRGRAGEVTTHSYKGPGPLGPHISGIGRCSDPSQEQATSVLVKSPAGDGRRASGESLLSGYQTSVIVKQEPHELEAMASMAASGNITSSHKHSVQSQEHLSEGVLGFSPESNDSGTKQDTTVSPGFTPGIDLLNSPSHTSVREDNTSVLSDDYLREQYKNRSDDHADSDAEGRQGSQLSLEAYQQGQYKMAEDGEESYNMDHVSNGEMVKEPVEPKDDMEDGRDVDMDRGDEPSGPSDIITTDKRDGKPWGSYKCMICGKCFETSGKLHLHEQLHTKFKPYSCRFCHQKFPKSAQRDDHEKTHNGVDTTNICAVCGTTFTRKYTLKLHMRKWHQEGPWLCRHCGKASLTQMELKSHLYSHNLPSLERESLLYFPDYPNQEPAYDTQNDEGKDDQTEGQETTSTQPLNYPAGQEMEMCQECGRDFPKGYLRYHLKSHEAQKPYSCPICAKRFGYKNNMKSHIKLHTGAKPFQCKMCGAKFTRGSTLRRHARRHGIIADSVWDLFIKPNYSKPGGGQTRTSNLDTQSTSNTDTSVTATNQTRTSSGGAGEVSNYLVSSISPTPNHGSLYPLYASFGRIPGVSGMYPGLSASTSYLAHLPHSSVYAASSHLPAQQLDALNLSVNKTMGDQQSDQSSFSNVSAERSRSRSRSLSGSESRPYTLRETGKPVFTVDTGTQVKTCCSAPMRKPTATKEPPSKHEDGADDGTTSPQSTPTPQEMSSPAPLAVVPYIVTSPSQRPSNLDSTSPALSISSGKDYALETISSLIGSGRMFKCFHCDCYFSEYAMYRIHAKLHNSDYTRPFVCLVCGEDCHDRVYFALHLSEHLR